ncbi:hypothetical protein B0J14DRAFT_674094 [Halenospora varia]|nr:hypothetical protein B0J14DRAFT_674094 [Halenospora varia]
MGNANSVPEHDSWNDPPTNTKPQDQLTFGVEIEFCLAILKRGEKIPTRMTHVAQTLNNAGIHAEPMLHLDFKEPNSKRWIVKGDTSVKPPDGYEMVTGQLMGKTEYEFVPMEITSPAYYFCEDSPWSKGAGLHVHIGNDGKGLKFKTARNPYATLWTFEPQILEIHPLHRQQSLEFTPFLREDSVLATTLKGLLNNSNPRNSRNTLGLSLPRNGLDRILHGFPGIEKLWRNMTHPTEKVRMAYNGENLQYRKSKMTIEFCQDESTLDPQRIIPWIRHCFGVIKFADVVKSQELETLLNRFNRWIDASPAEFGVGQVITAAGFPALGHYFEMRVEEQREKDRAQLLLESELRAKENLGPSNKADREGCQRSVALDSSNLDMAGPVLSS